MVVCAACGHENPGGSRFCNGCGAALVAEPSPREERKTVSVVFADLVGSTARAEQLDPEDVRAILAPYHARLRRELERHGGTVEKFIGDAVVGVFGAPVAHEDDAERAVRAALAIQEAITELNESDPSLSLEVRIGVNTGEALVNLGARPELGEAMVSGDVINTGARLQGAAPPGGVLVGASTHRATERVMVFEQHAAVAAKGKAEPVEAWRAVAPRAAFGLEHGDAGRAPLVGRERELALLVDAFERARSDQRPQLVTLVGVPGIGKSRLVHELSRLVDEDAELITWRRGRSLPYGEGVSYWALGEIVKAQAGILESDDGTEAGGKLEHAVRSLLTDPSEAAWVERCLRPLLGLASGDASPPREEAFSAHRRFLEAIAETGPAVLVFEDLHWADDDLLDFVDQLAERLDAVPLLIVCTARPELLSRRPGWGGGKPNAVTALLEQLSDVETAHLLAALLERPVLPADVQEAVLRRAGGVPLFAEEYARMLAAGEDAAAVPDTLQGIVAARIDALEAPEKALLQDAAVLGKVFWTDALAALAGGSPFELEERLRLLERREFVRRERRSAVEGARQYVFLHALVRDVAYAQVPRATRSERHRRAAGWIAALPSDRAEERAEMLGHHLGAAISFGEAAGLDVSELRPAAAAAWRDAGDRAWSLGIASRAAQLYLRAHEATGDAWDPALQLRYGHALSWAEGIGSEGERHLLEAADGLAAAGERGTAAVALMILSRARWNAGADDRDLADRALALVADDGPTLERGRVLEAAAIRLAIRGEGPTALGLADEALEIARSRGDLEREAEALNTRGVALAANGDLVAGIESTRQALALGLDIGGIDTARAYINVASLEGEYGELEASSRHHREGLALAERLGNRSYSDWLACEVVLDDLEIGSWDAVMPGAQELLTERATRGLWHYMDAALQVAVVVVTAAREGRLVDDLSDAALGAARNLAEPQIVLPTLAALADANRIVGRDDEAEALLDELVGAVARGASYGFPGAWVVTASLTWKALRDRPVPESLFTGQRTRWADVARHLRDGEMVEAADALEAMGATVAAADAREQAAVMLAAGDPVAASLQLERALSAWHAMRAEARIRRLDPLLARLRSAAS